MFTQRFEEMPEANRLEMLVDMLRYENAAQATLIQKLEGEIASLQAEVNCAREDADKLQQVLDMQNARSFRKLNS
ncbi:hypothetical protein PXK17_21455 [Phaeobacter gallaeciensis]|uniref:Uncharacterized protein n=1 Tax=Phaeobacter gallaeciensis TaxID=60890 RepID=A0ABD4XFF2_9RHOB|nr:hypothetical protein [Phaeobacter gallaeciensis]MDE4147158.1 hypothetical protein [Phaeobacter gallaeciensis]MDE4159801.1 hypothetical protein [Phaeobacter gallaeciensis]MDE4164020.1 hypothetical protein [Phaeobacter gallaeciensis]MDE4168251.1 hypothetical protein [Phaeobacter gallaeciensis]MDE4172473.1 hypothetical protein [Phaeobacter gallaeciensis]